MLIENRIKRKIEYEKTDREDKDESRLKEREIRSFQSKGNRIQLTLNSTILSNAEKSARRSKTSKKENLFAAISMFSRNSSNSSKNERTELIERLT